MKKIYIAGGGGMLGAAFYKVFTKDYQLRITDIDVNENWIDFLDFRDFGKYREDVRAFKPDYLFHLGAYTDLEYCENHPDDTYVTNTLAVENAVLIANQLDIPLLYISTAGIFDGSKEYYDDWDLPNPLGVYARTKYMAERYVVENAQRYLVCRAGWMMGAGPNKDKKFVNKIMKQIKGGATTLHIVDDKDGTPTYTIDFAKTVNSLIQSELWGLYNLVCSGQTSRLEVATEILRILNLDNSITIASVSSDFFAKEYFATRPASERLITKKIDLRGLNHMRDWRVALKEYIAEYYSDF
jgi:dTDP-4-dehydrorhamnose reductase